MEVIPNMGDAFDVNITRKARIDGILHVMIVHFNITIEMEDLANRMNPASVLPAG
jgi:hypothetical protein